MARKMFTKRSSQKIKKSKKKQKTSITVPSTVSPKPGTDDVSTKMVKKKGKPRESSGINIKVQCDLCKLSYSTEKELSEHLLSIMHHTKMEDKEENPVHICTLCFVTSPDMADYRMHVTTDKHQKNLSLLRGDDDSKSQSNNKRADKLALESNNPSTSKHISSASNKHNHQFQRGDILHRNKTPVSDGNQQNKSSYFKFGEKNRGFWNSLYQNQNNVNLWSKDQGNNNYREHSDDRQFIREAGPLENKHTNQYYEPWGSGFYGDYFGYHRTTELSLPYWMNVREQDRLKMNHAQQNETTARLNGPNFKRGVSNTIPEAWDEQLLLQQEQFLAGMDDMTFSNRHRSYRSPYPTNSDRQKQYNVNERKRARDDVQESLAKLSRPNDFSSDRGVPEKEILKMHQTTLAQNKSPSILPSDLNDHTHMSNTDSNVLNRLQIHTEILKAKNTLIASLKNQKFDKKGHSLQQEQQVSHTVYVAKDSERPHNVEASGSNVSSSLLLNKLRYSSANLAYRKLFTKAANSRKNVGSNTLDDIKKSIEKHVLDNEEELQQKIKSSAPPKRIRCTSGGAVTGTTSDSTIVTAGRPLPKLGCKPQLDKDSLKKIINAPHSRDERLQLAKMLQLRDGHKTGTANAPPRTNVQLEGLHDSVVVSQGVNLDAGQNCDIETIKLEDLSDSARDQILDLIGRDVSNQFHCPPEHSTGNMSLQNKLIKGKSSSRGDVIVLSDDDDLKKTVRQKKKTSKTISKITTTDEIDDVTTTKKKRKPVSKTRLIGSVVPSMCDGLKDSELTHHITHEPKISLVSEFKKFDLTRSKKQIPPKKEKMGLCTDNDMEIVSCSLDVELDRKQKKRKKMCHDFTKAAFVNTVSSSSSSSLSSSSTKQDILENETRSSELSSEQICSLPNSSSDREASPAIKIKSTFFAKKNGTNSSSLLGSSRQSSIQILDDAPDHIPDTLQNHIPDTLPNHIPDTLPVASNVQINLQSSSPHAGTRVRSATDLMVQSSSPHSKMKSSSLNIAIPSPPETETRPFCPDSSLSLAEPQKSPLKTTEALSTPQVSSPSTQLPKRLTLPPSTWLVDRTSPSPSCENNSRPASVEPSLLSPPVKDLKIEDNTGVTTVVTDDEDNCTAESEQLSSNQISSAVSAVINESPSQVMSELLVLSEREEDVKQEKMSLDLRLSRLHKLLEQAVVQINQCTERRQQLHKEEQELSHQRMSLLRAILSTPETSSLNPSSKSDAKEKRIPTSSSTFTPDENMSAVSTSTQFAEISKAVTSNSEHPQGTSLSKADWLAKFSSFLPRDPSRGDKLMLPNAFSTNPHSDLRELIHHSSMPVSSLSFSFPSDELVSERDTLPHQMTRRVGVEIQDSCGQSSITTASIRDQPFQALPGNTAVGGCRDIVRLHSRVSSDEGSSETSATATKPISSNLVAPPIMYLGTLKSASTQISVGTHVVNLSE